MLPLARGGVLITGSGGDELFGEWRTSRAADVLARRSVPCLRDWRALARALLPAVARRRLLARAAVPAWLSEAAREQLSIQLGRELADEPSFWSARMRWRTRRRWRALTNDTLALYGSDADVAIAHPLADPSFTAAVAHAGGRLGFGDRTSTMRALFSGILPDRVLARSDKAVFNGAFWTPRSAARIRTRAQASSCRRWGCER